VYVYFELDSHEEEGPREGENLLVSGARNLDSLFLNTVHSLSSGPIAPTILSLSLSRD